MKLLTPVNEQTSLHSLFGFQPTLVAAAGLLSIGLLLASMLAVSG